MTDNWWKKYEQGGESNQPEWWGKYETAPKEEWWSKFEQVKNKKSVRELEKELPGIWDSDFVKNLTFRGDKNTLDRSTAGFSTSAAKGIPILGKFAPQNDYQDQYEAENPRMAQAGEIAGGVMSTLPLSAGITALTGGKTLLNMAGQGTLGAGLKLGDRAVEKGPLSLDSKDIIDSLITGGVSAAGPAITRGISPTMPGPAPTNLQLAAKARGGSIPGIPSAKPPAMPAQKGLHPFVDKAIDKVTDSAVPALMGGVIGHGLGNIPAGLAVGALAPHVKDIAKTGIPMWMNNSKAHNPMVQAIINQLMLEAGQGMVE